MRRRTLGRGPQPRSSARRRRNALVASGVVVAVAVAVLLVPRGAGSEPQPTVTSTQTPPSGDVEPAESAPAAAPEPTRAPTTGGVVSSQTLATDAGAAILEQGGTAADASVAVAAVLSIVEPYYSSALGGDTWGLYYDADDAEVTSINGVGPAGSLVTLDDYRQRVSQYGMHQAIVPGAWDGWMLWLDEYGELDLGDVLAPAIAIARAGAPVTTEMRYWLTLDEANIRASPAMSAMYLRDGRLLTIGETFYQLDQAATFEAIVDAHDAARADGREAAIQAARDYVYRGPIAEAIAAYSAANGGYLTLEDFAGYEAEILEPISMQYDDVTVYQNPPSSQGVVMLEALSILEGYDFAPGSIDDPLTIHRQVEALKLAFADRTEYLGDPSRGPVPVDALLSEEYAAQQRDRIDDGTAMRWPIEPGLGERSRYTTTFHIVDTDGNAAAVTTSLGGQFLAVGATGIHINERMSFFSTDPNDVNVAAPGATVRHTSNPYLVTRDGAPYLLGGNTGVDRQPQGQLQQFMNVVEFGLSPQEAIDRPRFISLAFPQSNHPYATTQSGLFIEAGLPQSVHDGLSARGHAVTGQGLAGYAEILQVNPDATIEFGVETRIDTASGRWVVP